MDLGQVRQELGIFLSPTPYLLQVCQHLLPEADGHSLLAPCRRTEWPMVWSLESDSIIYLPTCLDFTGSARVWGCRPQLARTCGGPRCLGITHLALMRYWARLMLAGVPVMVI